MNHITENVSINNIFNIIFFQYFFLINDNTMSWNHSLEDSLEARTVLIEIFMLCSNLERPKTPGITSNMDFPEGNKLFVRKFCANLDKTNADMVQFTEKWNWK